MNKKDSKKGFIKKDFFRLLGLYAVVIISCIFMTGCGKVTVDLDKYITAETTGYNGYGRVKLIIDGEALERDFRDKISYTKEAKEIYGNLLSISTAAGSIPGLANFEYEDLENVSNGDQISYTLEVDEYKAEKYLNCKLKYSKSGVYTVTELPELETFDAFEDLDVSFEGNDSFGMVNLQSKNSAVPRAFFSAEPDNHLSNGDVVTISFVNQYINNIVESTGKVPEPREKQFTVEGLPHILKSISEIDSETLEAMKAEAKKSFDSEFEDSFTMNTHVEDCIYMGSVLLTPKDEERPTNSKLFLVYNGKISNDYSYKGKKYDKIDDDFWFIEYDGITVGTDGKVNVSLQFFKTPNDFFSVDSGIPTGWGFNTTWNYRGYQTYEELLEHITSEAGESYSIENTIEK